MKNTETKIESINKINKHRMLIDTITKVACKYYKEDINAVRSKKRKTELVKVRQVISYLARDTYKINYRLIAEYFTLNNAPAVMYNVSAIKKLLAIDDDLYKEITLLKDMLYINGTSIVNNIELEKEFYVVDLNDCVSIKLSNNKAILLSGFNEDEVKAYIEGNNIRTVSQQHINTGIYMLKPLRNRLLNGNKK